MPNDACVAQVLEAARDLVAAFARTDTEAYFAAFSEDASFIFHTWPQPLPTRAAYREVWEGWLREDGFAVLDCQSSNTVVSLHGDVAIFSHDVATRLRIQGAESLNHERETIVFRRTQEQGRWLAVHEHLSAAPTP
ncbi:nuclear transport factor 2 family protein [Pseudomonas panipatensis]|uniref:Ketosteroid isomerase homolog n=1 Tax=Pseudomonas panipatensis TaxID=428992 RepID=A0A1G8GEN7_9PSED|nr:nuclear transport factor 2 family protein [Pseudomonas panipatensis]SDH92806.1 Ketosteroid isomerase homolog [Pseudomonas panipatensis]SMP43704.1 Ketosteroid isomerase homolog [Pseudomonas panipatensis]